MTQLFPSFTLNSEPNWFLSSQNSVTRKYSESKAHKIFVHKYWLHFEQFQALTDWVSSKKDSWVALQ